MSKRTVQFSMRLDPDEKDDIERSAKAAGVSMTEWVLAGCRPRFIPPPSDGSAQGRARSRLDALRQRGG